MGLDQEIDRLATLEGELGLDRVYQSDTEWSYELDVETADRVTTGFLTWRYDGQQVHTDEPEPYCGALETVAPEEVLTGIEFDPLAYLALVEVDRHGRRWVLDAVDVAAAEEELTAAGVVLGEDVGEDGIAGIELGLEGGGEPLLVEPTSWSIRACATQASFFEESGSGLIVQHPTTPEDATSMKIVQVTAGGQLCSGALVREDAC